LTFDTSVDLTLSEEDEFDESDEVLELGSFMKEP